MEQSLELPQDQPLIPAISKLEQKDGEDLVAYIARPCLKRNKDKAVVTGGSERLKTKQHWRRQSLARMKPAHHTSVI